MRALTFALMDTGCRINEFLSLERSGLDFDNMLIKLMGKRSKERVVPMSFELRKILFKYLKTHEYELALPSRTGTKWDYRNDWFGYYGETREYALSPMDEVLGVEVQRASLLRGRCRNHRVIICHRGWRRGWEHGIGNQYRLSVEELVGVLLLILSRGKLNR